MPHLYLTSYEAERDALGNFAAWTYPSPHVVGVLDARSLPECADRTMAPPRSLFSLSQADPNLDGYLGEFTRDTLDSHISRSLVDMAEDNLRLPRGTIRSDTPRLMIAEVLTEHADPTGQDRWKPFLAITLCGFSPIWRTDLRVDSPARRLWLERRRHDFRLIYQESMEGLLGVSVRMGRDRLFVPDTQHHRKVLGDWVRRYRLPWEQFVPADLMQDVRLQGGPRAPTTTITESFDTGDGDTLGPDLTWTEVAQDWDIVSNNAQMVGGDQGSARAESALSSDAHYAKVNWQAGTTSGYVGAASRFATAATTYYVGAWWPGLAKYRISKVVAGSRTDLFTGANDSVAAGVLIKMESADDDTKT